MVSPAVLPTTQTSLEDCRGPLRDPLDGCPSAPVVLSPTTFADHELHELCTGLVGSLGSPKTSIPAPGNECLAQVLTHLAIRRRLGYLDTMCRNMELGRNG